MPAPSPLQIVAEFVPLSEQDAATALTSGYDLDVVQLDRLPTERDDTFRVHTPHGQVVAKFAHPLDDAEELHEQITTLTALAREHPALPVQRVVPARDGQLLTRIIDGVGQVRQLRVLTYLEGELFGARARPLSAVHTVGALHAQLAVAITAIGDTAQPPLLGAATPWNLLSVEHYGPLVDAIIDSDVRREAAGVVARFVQAGLARARALPAVLAHNDMHGDNVLVSVEPGVVTGVLDFGDMTRTPRVADLAVAASYARGRAQSTHEPWAAARAYVCGYESEQPLSDDEHCLLPELVLLRLAQRAILNSAIAAANPTATHYASRNLSAIGRDLRELGAVIPSSLITLPCQEHRRDSNRGMT